MSFDHGPNAEGVTELEKLFVLVGGIYKKRFSCLGAPDGEDVVFVRSYNNLVDFDSRRLPMKSHGQSLRPRNLVGARAEFEPLKPASKYRLVENEVGR